MRTLSLTQLHERAIAVLDLMRQAEQRLGNYAGRLENFRSWENHDRLKHQMDITAEALHRLILHYSRLVERINATLAKSLQTT